MARWTKAGAGVSVLSGRFRALRSALGWANCESIIERSPIGEMRGPPRPGTRMHAPLGDVTTLIETSEQLAQKAEAAVDGTVSSLLALHKAEQVRLLVRLAVDSGARRGELAAQHFRDPGGCQSHQDSSRGESPLGGGPSPWVRRSRSAERQQGGGDGQPHHRKVRLRRSQSAGRGSGSGVHLESKDEIADAAEYGIEADPKDQQVGSDSDVLL